MSFLLYVSTCTWEFLKPGVFVFLSSREILDTSPGTRRPEARSPLGGQWWCRSSPRLRECSVQKSKSIPGRTGERWLSVFIISDRTSPQKGTAFNNTISFPSSPHASFKATLPPTTWPFSREKPAVYITAVRQRWHITSGPPAYNGFFKCVAMFSWLVVGDLKCQTISLDNYCQGYYLREISF